MLCPPGPAANHHHQTHKPRLRLLAVTHRRVQEPRLHPIALLGLVEAPFPLCEPSLHLFALASLMVPPLRLGHLLLGSRQLTFCAHVFSSSRK